MVVRIRLARFGKRNAPFYNIVVSHARFDCLPRIGEQNLTEMDRTARNSKPIEVIGMPVEELPLSPWPVERALIRR